jgi:hypothetical protein
MNAEVEQRGEEVGREPIPDATLEARAQDDVVQMVLTISRASGVESGCFVTRTKPPRY